MREHRVGVGLGEDVHVVFVDVAGGLVGAARPQNGGGAAAAQARLLGELVLAHEGHALVGPELPIEHPGVEGDAGDERAGVVEAVGPDDLPAEGLGALHEGARDRQGVFDQKQEGGRWRHAAPYHDVARRPGPPPRVVVA
ncbi:MAG TPA: hypothetical protein VFS43_07855 [Polyangiaceae bacterium]|nr:hypothetical protein [Polyangiaceae bacterium]